MTNKENEKHEVSETMRGCGQRITATGETLTEAYSKLDAKMSLHIMGCKLCKDHYRQGMSGGIWSL